MTLRQIAPTVIEDLAVGRLLGGLGPPLAPFAVGTEAFGAALSGRLLADPLVRRYPDLASLAFWLRPASTRRLRRHFETLSGDGVVRVPRGMAFHVAPGNVETLFVYSWWLSLLCGNATIVRISSQSGERTARLLDLIAALLAEPRFADLRAATAIIATARDDESGAALSLAADLRVVWGGDATVAAFRAMPLRPDATELVFPDRRSMAAMAGAAYLDLDAAGRDRLVERFFNDAYWFDQKACSSPLMLAWIGSPKASARASADFWPRLAAKVAAMGYDLPVGARLAKLTEAARLVLDGAAQSVARFGEAVLVASGPALSPRPASCGGGLFQEVRIEAIGQLADLVDRRLQTIAHFGVTKAELDGLARRLNGRGGERLVPVGDALAFSHIWDGHDLLAAMSRAITVQPEP